MAPTMWTHALAAFRTAARETIAMLGQLSAGDWARTATFAEYG